MFGNVKKRVPALTTLDGALYCTLSRLSTVNYEEVNYEDVPVTELRTVHCFNEAGRPPTPTASRVLLDTSLAL